MCEHAGDVVPPRVPVDGASGFVVAVTLGPGVEEVADLPRRVAGAATVHLEVRPGRGADRGSYLECRQHSVEDSKSSAARIE